MKLLAMDTTASACSAAVWDNGAIVERLLPMSRGHAEALVPMLRDVMHAAKLGFRDLDAVAVSVGPGAFTGLRVGLATARGIALGAGVPCLGVPTLQAIAHSVDWTQAQDDIVLIALDTRRGDFYVQAFHASRPVAPPEVSTESGLAATYSGQRLLLAGDAGATLATALTAAGLRIEVLNVPPYPTAGRVAALAAARWQAGERPRTPPSPVYLRPPATCPNLTGLPR